MKLSPLFAIAIALSFSSRADAQILSGSLNTTVDPFIASSSSFTSSSFTLSKLNLIMTGETGTFAADVPALGDLTADTATISGLSSTATSENIKNFFVFSSPDSVLSSSTGSNPADRFNFTLSSVTETSFTGSAATFIGTGTINDDQNAAASSAASFVLAYSSQSGYTITLTTQTLQSTPEPSTWALMIGGLGVLVFFTRRGYRARA